MRTYLSRDHHSADSAKKLLEFGEGIVAVNSNGDING